MRIRSTPVVVALELPHRFGAVDQRFADIDRLIDSSPDADLLLLPECAITGYVSPAGDFDLRRFAEPIDGPTSARLAGLARRYDIAIAAPMIEAAGDKLFNAHIVFNRDGQRIAHYRKRHPWFPERWATPGDLPMPIFEIAGSRFTIAICFDVHFLAADAARELNAADILLFPSAWTEEGADSRDELLPALARQFDISIVNANWGRGDPLIEGQGASRIIDRRGRELIRAGLGVSSIAAVLDESLLDSGISKIAE